MLKILTQFQTGYHIGFDSHTEFSLPDGSVGKNVIIFWVNMSSSVQISNKKKYILILVYGSTHVLDDSTLTAEAQYSISFSRSNRTFCLSLHYNGRSSFLFANATKIYQSKTKDFELKKNPAIRGNISRDFSANMKKSRIKWVCHHFSVGYRRFDASNFIGIHKYLTKKHNIK